MSKIEQLDGLKFIGAVMVFLCHYRMFGLLPEWSGIWSVFLNWLSDGDYAVYIFLIISGFCASLSIQRKMESQSRSLRALSKYVQNRYFRLAVPSGIVLLCCFFLYIAGAFLSKSSLALNMHPVAENAYHGLSFGGLMKALFLSPLGMDFGFLAPLWMMKYIFLGSFLVLMARFAVYNCGKVPSLIILTFVFFLSLSCSKWYAAVVSGVLLSELYGHFDKCKYSFYWSLFLLLIAILVRWKASLFSGSLFISSFCLVSSTLFHGFPKMVFSFRPLSTLGKYSYSVYLIHWPLVCSLSPFMWNKLPIDDSYILHGAVLFLTIIMMIPFVIGLNVIDKATVSFLREHNGE